MKKLYYSYVWPPVNAHIISKKLGINKKYNPWECMDDSGNKLPIGVCEFFSIVESGDYEMVKLCLDATGNSAYYYDDEGCMVEVTGWIDLFLWENGGEMADDPNRKLTKEEFEKKYRRKSRRGCDQ